MADITVTYKGSTIGEISASGSHSINTAGTYCEDDIGISYTSPGGGGFDIMDSSEPIGAVSSDTSASIEMYTLAYRTGVSSIHLKNASALKNTAISYCSALTTFVGEKIIQVANYALRNNVALTAVDVLGNNGAYDRFYANAMANCTVLETLIIRAEKVMALGDLTAFNGTKFASNGSGGTLYVPQSMISSYQSATNWSTLLGYANNQIKKIEGSIYETQYADGTAIS